MDLVPTPMLANLPPAPSSANVATMTAVSGFAALLAMVEQSAAGATELPVEKNPASSERPTKGGTTVTAEPKNGKAATAQAQPAKKQDLSDSAASVLNAVVPVLPPNVPVPTSKDNAI